MQVFRSNLILKFYNKRMKKLSSDSSLVSRIILSNKISPTSYNEFWLMKSDSEIRDSSNTPYPALPYSRSETWMKSNNFFIFQIHHFELFWNSFWIISKKYTIHTEVHYKTSVLTTDSIFWREGNDLLRNENYHVGIIGLV